MTTIEQIKSALQAHIAEAEAATPGPWDVNSKYVGRMADAAFIAHARTMSPLVCRGYLQMIEWLEFDESYGQTSTGILARSRLEFIRQEWHNLTTK
jgi:hypothetical protein